MKIIEAIKYLRWENSLPFYTVLCLGLVLGGKPILDLITTPEYLVKIVLLSVAFILLSIALFFAINDYFDSKLDRLTKRKRNPLTDGKMTKRGMLALFVATCGTGLFLTYLVNVYVFILAILSILSIYLYSAEPFRFKGRFILDWVTHSLPGVFLFMAGYLTVADFRPEILLCTIPVFLIYVLVCDMQQLWDFESDKKFGLKTTVSTLGLEKTILSLKMLVISIFVSSIFVFIVLPPILIIALLSLPVSVFLLKLRKENISTFEKDYLKNVKLFYIGALIVLPFLIMFRII